MKFVNCEIPDVVIVEPSVFGDSRGYFFESYNQGRFSEKIQNIDFVQDNESMSSYGTLRGLHYQLPPFAQSKLVRVIVGKVMDVVVDIRKSSPTYGHHVAVELSEDNKRQLYIPKGFAHGFVTLSESAIFVYKVDDVYAPDCERTIRYDDASLNIDWKLSADVLNVSEKDLGGCSLAESESFEAIEQLYA